MIMQLESYFEQKIQDKADRTYNSNRQAELGFLASNQSTIINTGNLKFGILKNSKIV